jgi:predicted metal-binding membrane protein
MTMKADDRLIFVLRREGLVVVVGLSLVVFAATAYTVMGVGMDMSALTMTRMALLTPGMSMPDTPWSLGYAVLVVAMWWAMMIAMMVPSAAPMLLFHAAVAGKSAPPRAPVSDTFAFLAGYLCIWAAFSVAATGLQWGLHTVGVLTGMMDVADPVVAGVLLIGAGLYQFTPLKQACLRQCKSPLAFITAHWRRGRNGAFRMGLQHGAYCLGCCWFLMALLFVGGVMNLMWIAGIAAYVALEKFSGRRRWPTLGMGILLVALGLLVLARSVV